MTENLKKLIQQTDFDSLDDEQKAKFWGERIERAKKYQEQETAKNWEKSTRYLLGDQWFETLRDKEELTHLLVTNILWHVLRTFLPALYLEDPYVLVETLPDDLEGEITSVYEDQERWLQSRMNTNITERKFKREFRESIQDVILLGFGVAKSNWIEESHLYNKDGTPVSSRLKDRLLEASSASVKRVSPRDWICDCDARNFKEIRWCAERIVLPYDDFLRNDKYEKRDEVIPSLFTQDKYTKERGQGIRSSSVEKVAPSRVTEMETSDLLDSYIEIWEIWDFSTDRLFAVAEGNKGLLLRETERPYKDIIDALPYHLLIFNDVNDVLYPPSDIEMIIPHQEQLNWIRSIQVSWIHKLIGIGVYDRTRLKEQDMEQMERAAPGSYIGIEGPVDGIMNRLDALSVPGDHYVVEDKVKSEVWEMAGLSQAARNMPLKGETATGQVQRESYMDARMADRLNFVKDFILECLDDCAKLLIANEGDKEVPISVNTGGQRRIIKMKANNFPRKFNLSLETSTTFPTNRQMRINQFLQAVNLVGNNPNVDQRELAIKVFELFEVKGIEKLVPSIMVPAEVIALLQNDPQLLTSLMQAAQMFFQQQQGARKMTDVNAPGNIPVEAAPISTMQGGRRR